MLAYLHGQHEYATRTQSDGGQFTTKHVLFYFSPGTCRAGSSPAPLPWPAGQRWWASPERTSHPRI